MLVRPVRISKTFDFDAAHWLPCVSENHKCRRMHGHTYRVEFILCGPHDGGMLVDYAEIAEAWKAVHDQLDHRVLNDIDGLAIPTTEVLVWWIFEKFYKNFPHMLEIVRVFESSTTYAEARIGDF